MDIRQYIESGVIEAYVIGIASAEEVYELERLAAKHPEIATALDDCRQSMENYAGLHAVTPPSGLKEEIWSALENDGKNTVPLPGHSDPDFANTGNVTDFLESKTKGKMVMLYRTVAAAAVLLLVSLACNVIFWNRSKTTETSLAALKQEQQQLIDANRQVQQQMKETNQRLALVTDPEVKPVVLAGVGTHTTNHGMVFWDTRSKEVYLSLKDLPPPPSGKQYQLWAIVDGKPVDAGMYALHTAGVLQKMKVIPAAQMFAITLEKEGGSPEPTMDAMYVAGKV